MTQDVSDEDDGLVRPADFLRLADRYHRHGLFAAARGLLSRLVDVATVDGVAVAALRRLAALDLVARDFSAARSFCEAALDRVDLSDARRPSLERLATEVALAAGDVVGAARYLRGLSDDGTPADRASAQLLAAELALRGGDEVAATRLIGALLGDLDELQEHAIETLAALATRAGGVDRWRGQLQDLKSPRARFVEALVLEAETNVNTKAVEALLEEAAGDLVGARVALASRRARRRGRDPSAREAAVSGLEEVLADPSSLSRGSRVHVELFLASLYDDDAAGADRAAAIYRRAIPELPRDGTAYNNLGVIALGQGEVAEAERWFIRALVADPEHRLASCNLARIFYVAGSAEKLGASLERLREAGASGDLLARISHALVEVTRDDAREGIAGKGHELKNILGVLGTRLRRLAREAEGVQGQKLSALHQKLSAVYDEWALYLRTVREEVVAIDTVDLKTLATEAIRQVGVPVRLDLAAERLEIQGLRGQLIEAVVNLLRNAVEAGGEGAELRIVTGRGRGDQVVYLDVIDDGDGIPLADLRRVLHAGYTTKRDGSGLGLSISERIVRAHGGRLDIDSRPGEGTRVRIELPLRLESPRQHGMLQASAGRVLRAARAEEYVAEE